MKPTKKSRAQALFSAHPPTLTLPIQHTFGLRPRSKRTLQLRGPLLLLSKTPTPTASDRLLLLRPHTPPLANGSRAATLQGHKLYFESGAHRDQFLAAARGVVEAVEEAPKRYAVIRRIGNGASGVVYLVRRRADGKLLAMKTLNKESALASESQLRHLVTERIALSEAAERSSPFIVRLLDAFETDKELCFVTELGSFGDLRGIIRKLPSGRCSERVARELFAEILLGLEEVHEMGFLYRDLKLGNLLLCRDGHVRLADFGLAKRVISEEEGQVKLGRARSFVGTRRYMSPEHLDTNPSRAGYGMEADVWALGVSLYLLLVGEYPFGRGISPRNATGMFHAILTEDVTFPEFLSDDVVDLLRGMLERQVEKRLSLQEIKKHAWLHRIQFEDVRRRAMEGVPQGVVLRALKEGGIKVVEDGVGQNCGTKILDGGSSERRRSLGRVVGFGYLGAGKRVAVH